MHRDAEITEKPKTKIFNLDPYQALRVAATKIGVAIKYQEAMNFGDAKVMMEDAIKIIESIGKKPLCK